MKYVCTVRRDSTGMKLRMVMDGDNRRVLRQSVERHFWAVRGWVDETAMLEHMQRFPRSSPLLRSILEVAILPMHISAVLSPI